MSCPDPPLLTTSSPPLCSRSPDRFPWMPTALACKDRNGLWSVSWRWGWGGPQEFPPLSNHKPWRLHHEQVFPGQLARCLSCCTYKDIRVPSVLTQCPAPPIYLTQGSARSATSLTRRIYRSPRSPQAEYSWPGGPREVCGVWGMNSKLDMPGDLA